MSTWVSSDHREPTHFIVCPKCKQRILFAGEELLERKEKGQSTSTPSRHDDYHPPWPPEPWSELNRPSPVPASMPATRSPQRQRPRRMNRRPPPRSTRRILLLQHSVDRGTIRESDPFARGTDRGAREADHDPVAPPIVPPGAASGRDTHGAPDRDAPAPTEPATPPPADPPDCGLLRRSFQRLRRSTTSRTPWTRSDTQRPG